MSVPLLLEDLLSAGFAANVFSECSFSERPVTGLSFVVVRSYWRFSLSIEEKSFALFAAGATGAMG